MARLSCAIALALALAASSCTPRLAPHPRGPMAPDFTLNDVDGEAVTLSKLRGRGVVLSFWFLA